VFQPGLIYTAKHYRNNAANASDVKVHVFTLGSHWENAVTKRTLLAWLLQKIGTRLLPCVSSLGCILCVLCHDNLNAA
jgi:hypothetical protein